MSSMLRSTAQILRTPNKFHRLESPCYFDNSLNYNALFPFTYSNGTLDIAYIDNFEADMVTSTGNEPNTDPDVSVKFMGGERLVQSLGPNFLNYIRAWRTGIDAGTPINIYINGTVQRVQATTNNFLGDSSFEVSTVPPTSDNYNIGSADNNYRSTYVFVKPLTITTVESGVTQYITFATRYDED